MIDDKEEDSYVDFPLPAWVQARMAEVEKQKVEADLVPIDKQSKESVVSTTTGGGALEEVIKKDIFSKHHKEETQDFFIEHLEWLLARSTNNRYKYKSWRSLKSILKSVGHWKNLNRGIYG